MKTKILTVLLALTLIALIVVGIIDRAGGEEETVLYVTATQLNGRANPRRTGILEALFDKGTIVVSTGRWSRDYKWIEVYGGECETVWVSAKYVSEIQEPITVTTEFNKVKIRNNPCNGRTTGYLKSGKTLQITQVVLGWGKCSKGWIDLSYCDWSE